MTLNVRGTLSTWRAAASANSAYQTLTRAARHFVQTPSSFQLARQTDRGLVQWPL